MAEDAVDWNQYFESIRTVCPWSLGAWRREGIDIQHWSGEARPLHTWEARIYLAPRHKPRQLKKMADKCNTARPTEEWLWSHPSYGNHSTPIACFIQQHRKVLENIRKSLEKQ